MSQREIRGSWYKEPTPEELAKVRDIWEKGVPVYIKRNSTSPLIQCDTFQIRDGIEKLIDVTYKHEDGVYRVAPVSITEFLQWQEEHDLETKET